MIFNKAKKNVLLETIKDNREEIRRKIIAELSQEQRKMDREGRYPYEELWLKLPEIEAIQKKLKRGNSLIISELLFLFGLMLASSYGIYRLLIWILPP